MDAVTRHQDYEFRISVTAENGRYVPKMLLQRATGGSGPSLQEIPNALGSFTSNREAHQAATAYLTRIVEGRVPGLKV